MALATAKDPTVPEIWRLAADMQDTREDIGASGLAAPASLRKHPPRRCRVIA